MPRIPMPSTLTAKALLAADVLTPAERAALATVDVWELWRRGEFALACALNPFMGLVDDGGHVLTPAEWRVVDRLSEKLWGWRVDPVPRDA